MYWTTYPCLHRPLGYGGNASSCNAIYARTLILMFAPVTKVVLPVCAQHNPAAATFATYPVSFHSVHAGPFISLQHLAPLMRLESLSSGSLLLLLSWHIIALIARAFADGAVWAFGWRCLKSGVIFLVLQGCGVVNDTIGVDRDTLLLLTDKSSAEANAVSRRSAGSADSDLSSRFTFLLWCALLMTGGRILLPGKRAA